MLVVEQVVGKPRVSDRLAALATALLLPVPWLERALGCTRGVGMNHLARVFLSAAKPQPKS